MLDRLRKSFCFDALSVYLRARRKLLALALLFSVREQNKEAAQMERILRNFVPNFGPHPEASFEDTLQVGKVKCHVWCLTFPKVHFHDKSAQKKGAKRESFNCTWSCDTRFTFGTILIMILNTSLVSPDNLVL